MYSTSGCFDRAAFAGFSALLIAANPRPNSYSEYARGNLRRLARFGNPPRYLADSAPFNHFLPNRVIFTPVKKTPSPAETLLVPANTGDFGKPANGDDVTQRNGVRAVKTVSHGLHIPAWLTLVVGHFRGMDRNGRATNPTLF